MREYWNKHKWTLLITSVVILLPILCGILLWDKLPDEIAIHWGVNGEADSWASKAFAVFMMPPVLLVLQWVCFFSSAWDPKGKNISKKMLGLVLWIIPILSLLIGVLVYANALNRRVDVSVIVPLFMGALFVVIGNYLPKCKQSYTMGIKLPWTLNNEENWNATHRLAGKLWVAGGLLVIPCTLLPPVVCFSAMMGILLVMCIVPTVYSYRLYKKKQS